MLPSAFLDIDSFGKTLLCDGINYDSFGKKNHLGLRVLYQYRYGLRNDVCEVHSCILPPFPKASTPRIRASQTFLTLTNFIEKSINIYNIK